MENDEGSSLGIDWDYKIADDIKLTKILPNLKRVST